MSDFKITTPHRYPIGAVYAGPDGLHVYAGSIRPLSYTEFFSPPACICRPFQRRLESCNGGGYRCQACGGRVQR